MSRDISDAVPDELASLIRDSYGSIPALADACGLGYHAVYSMLARSGGERSLAALDLLVEKAGCTYEEAASIYRCPPGDRRRQKLEAMASRNGWTLRKLSDICWGNETYIYKVITGKSASKHTPNLLKVIDALGLDPKRFEELIKNREAAA